MAKKHIYFFIGTNAELIKVAPVIRELERRNIKYSLITSGQTRVEFKDLGGYIRKQSADIIFPPKKNKASVYFFLLWTVKTIFLGMVLLKKELKGVDKNNTCFIIQGDTVSSTIGACIAKLYGIKVAHIESGDLSFNLFEPFPEELCRNINIRLADILFPPTDWAKNNLKNFMKPVISTKQDTIIETFLWAMKKNVDLSRIKNLGRYYILIIHRQEHVIFRKQWSKNIMNFVIKNANKNLNCVIINHPLTVNIINSLYLGSKTKKIKIISQLPYPVFLKLIKNAEFMASDGATHQQETYYMGKPLLSLRNYTEQIEGLDGNVVLYKNNLKVVKDFLTNYKKYQSRPVTIRVRPSKIIVDHLLKLL